MLAVVLLVVVGPRELPRLLRTVGQGITKLRRMSTDLRQQSGIDDIIEDEGLRDDLQAIRSLSRGNVVENFVNQATRPAVERRAAGEPVATEDLRLPGGPPPPPDQEYPPEGCDAYGALPDDDPAYGDDDSAEPAAEAKPQSDLDERPAAEEPS